MKKLLFAISLGIAAVAGAAEQKICTIQFAGMNDLGKAASRLGEMTGNQMLGIMLTGQLMSSEELRKAGALTNQFGTAVDVYNDFESEALPRIDFEHARALDKSMDGNLVRIKVPGLKSLKIPAEQLKECPTAEGFDGLICALKLTDKGLEIQGGMKTVAGTYLGKWGCNPLQKNPLAFAKNNAVSAIAIGKDCGQGDCQATYRKIIACLKQHGIEIDRFWQCEDDKSFSRYTLDLKAAVQYVSGMETNRLSQVNPEKLFKELSELEDFKAKAGKIDGTPFAYSLAYKGAKPKVGPAARLAKVLPEANDKPAVYVSVGSIYALIRQAALEAVPVINDETQREMASMMVAQMPEENEGGAAAVIWREKEMLKFMARLSTDEIKNLSTIVNSCLGMVMSTFGGMEGVDDDDDDDSSDDDDED